MFNFLKKFLRVCSCMAMLQLHGHVAAGTILQLQKLILADCQYPHWWYDMCHCGLLNTCMVYMSSSSWSTTVLLYSTTAGGEVWQRHGLLGQQPSCSLHALMNTRLGLYFSNTAVISSTATRVEYQSQHGAHSCKPCTAAAVAALECSSWGSQLLHHHWWCSNYWHWSLPLFIRHVPSVHTVFIGGLFQNYE